MLIQSYSGNNATKSPALGAGKVGEPTLTLQVAIVCVVICLNQIVSTFGAVQLPAFVCLHRSAIMSLSWTYVRCIKLALKAVQQNEEDFVDAIV